MHRKSKAQSAVEFVSTYAFVFLIIAIILFLLFMFASVPTKILPFQCTAFSGFSCVDVLYTTAGNSLLQISLTDTQAGVVSIGSFGAKINNVAATDGTCTRGAVLPGNTVTCTVRFPFAAALGGIYTGVFNVSANYCTNGVGNISNTTCQTGNSFIYAGSFTVQVQKPALPQYVAYFNGQTGNSYMSATVNGIAGSTVFTSSLWVNLVKLNVQQNLAFTGLNTGNDIVPYVTAGNVFHCWTTSTDLSSGVTVSSGAWYLFTCTYAGSSLNAYVNGVLKANTPLTGFSLGGNLISVGSDYAGSVPTNGLISNFQIYNTALTPMQIQNLYSEGIGGTPINVANNIGWWSLNNNANDVSGGGNNGVASNVVYNSLWISGYTAP